MTAPNQRSTPHEGIRPLVDFEKFGGDAADPDSRRVRVAHQVYEHLIALWAPAIIEAAYELGVFTELARRPRDCAGMAEALSADVRGTRVLLDALHAYGMVDRIRATDDTASYALASEFWSSLLPGGEYSLVGKMRYDRMVAWDAWRGLSEAVRHGSMDKAGRHRANQISTADYEFLTGGINFWAPPIVARLREGLSAIGWDPGQPVRMLDVGCGTGIYSQLLLRRQPSWTATGLDAPKIISKAAAQAERLGVAPRFTGRACDFWREDWGDGFDLVLFANIFHLQDPESARRLMISAASALSDRGVVCIADHIVNDSRDATSAQDRFALLFAASMLATGGGDCYTYRDYDSWFGAAGLRKVRVLDTPMHRILIASR